jgi:putative ABC transport system ATP-binding protein
LLRIEAARKVFHRGRADEKVALDGLDLHLSPGDFAVVIGSNGAGKSSLLNAVAGTLTLDEGRVAVNGVDITGLAVHRRAAWLARVFQDPMRGTAAGMTVAENMLLADLRGRGRGLRRGLHRARRASYGERLAVLGLGLEDRLDTPVDLLSGGQRQSLSLVMAVGGAPDVLLLDEHTAALDPRTAEIVMRATVRAVDTHGLTALMVTHNMQHAIDYGNRIVMMDRGRVVRALAGRSKAEATVADLIGYFSAKSDRMLLTA